MRLSDIMSAMQLVTYPEIAMLLFMAAFLAICVQVFRRGNAATWEQARHQPLEAESRATYGRTPARRHARGRSLAHRN